MRKICFLIIIAALFLTGCSFRDLSVPGAWNAAKPEPVGKVYSAALLQKDLEEADAAGTENIDLVYDKPDGLSTETVDADLASFLGSFRFALFDDSCRYEVSEDPGRIYITVRRTGNALRDKKEDFLPGGRACYAGEEGLRSWLDTLVRGNGIQESALFLMDDPPAAEELTALVESTLTDNEYALYFLSRYEVSVLRFTDAFYTELTLTRREDVPGDITDLDTMTDSEFVQFLIDRNQTWAEVTAVHFSGSRDIEALSYLGEVAAANDPFDMTCPPASRVTEEYAGAGGTILVLRFEYPEGTDGRDALRTPMQQAITDLAREIIAESEGMSDAEKYALIAQKITDRTDYDYDLADAITNGTTEPEQNYLETAYGALISGHTVCSGYTAAFKAVCDMMRLPCFVIHGVTENRQGVKENHAWCAVLCDGELRYIDPTYMDFNDTGAYFLFPDYESADGRTEENGWICPIG